MSCRPVAPLTTARRPSPIALRPLTAARRPPPVALRDGRWSTKEFGRVMIAAEKVIEARDRDADGRGPRGHGTSLPAVRRRARTCEARLRARRPSLAHRARAPYTRRWRCVQVRRGKASAANDSQKMLLLARESANLQTQAALDRITASRKRIEAKAKRIERRIERSLGPGVRASQGSRPTAGGAASGVGTPNAAHVQRAGSRRPSRPRSRARCRAQSACLRSGGRCAHALLPIPRH